MNYIFAAIAGVATVAIVLSVWDLFFREDDLEEMYWLPLD